jgi:hypothetical protein
VIRIVLLKNHPLAHAHYVSPFQTPACMAVACLSLFNVLLGLILLILGIVALTYSFPSQPDGSGYGHEQDSIDRYRNTAVTFGLLPGAYVFCNSCIGYLAAYNKTKMGLLMHALLAFGGVIVCVFGMLLPQEMSETFQDSCDAVIDKCCDLGGTCDADWRSSQYETLKVCRASTEVCAAGGFWYANECVKCTAGTFKTTTKSGCCDACASDSFSIEGATLCTKCADGPSCPAGQWGSSADSACHSCPAGRFKAEAGNDCCESCGSGYESGLGAAVCTSVVDCRTGFYRQSGQCNACPAGKYSSIVPGVGTTFCADCPEGKFQPLGAKAACDLCPTGQYSDLVLSNAVCSACSIGTFQDTTGQTACKACAAGQTTSPDGAACAAGVRRQLRVLSVEDATRWPVLKAFETLAVTAATAAATAAATTAATASPRVNETSTANGATSIAAGAEPLTVAFSRLLAANETAPTPAPSVSPTMGSFNSHEDLCSWCVVRSVIYRVI